MFPGVSVQGVNVRGGGGGGGVCPVTIMVIARITHYMHLW